MRRRHALTVLLGAAAGAYPAATWAQTRTPRLGILFVGNPEPHLRQFRDGLRQLGYVDGRTVQLDVRTAEGQLDRLPALAAELVALEVNIIVAFQTPAATAAKQATSNLPIVMASAGDPVATGLVASLARPGGNITGMSSTSAELGGKLMELVREMLPPARRVAVLANASDPFTTPLLDHIERGARTVGLAVQALKVNGEAEFDAAFDAMRRERADAFIHQPSLPRRRAIALAATHRLPSLSQTRVFAEDGGVVSYAADLAVQYRAAALYVDKILKGAKPADLPVQQPTRYELVLNLKAANAIGLTLPVSMIERADEVIE